MTTANVSPVNPVQPTSEVSRTFYVWERCSDFGGGWVEASNPRVEWWNARGYRWLKVTHTLQTFRVPFNGRQERCRSIFRIELPFVREGSVMLDTIQSYFGDIKVTPHHCGYGFFDVEMTF